MTSPGLSTLLTTLSPSWNSSHGCINTVCSSGSCSQPTFGNQFPLAIPEIKFLLGPALCLFLIFPKCSLSNLSTTIVSSTTYSLSVSKSNSQLKCSGYWLPTHSNRSPQRFFKQSVSSFFSQKSTSSLNRPGAHISESLAYFLSWDTLPLTSYG